MGSGNVISRYGARTCSNMPFIGDLGKACCQTDLCNIASNTSPICFVLLLGLLMILFRLK